MERYGKYKDSGVEWIGEIPEEWVVKKLKCFISKAGSGITPRGGASVYQLTGIPLLRSQNIHFGGLKLDDVAYITQEIHDEMSNSKVFSGDILLNITGASIGRCYYVTDSLGEANVNQHVCILRPIKKFSTEFLYFILRSDIGQEQINFEQTGSGREGLNFEALKNFLIPSIGLDEQTAIANYLDRKTAQIDKLIAQKERLIELYEEEKTAIINRCVTKGIDPDVRLKDSGIDWLGDIPEGWEVKKLKFLISNLESGVSVNSTDFPASDQSYGVLKTSCVYKYVFEPCENKEIWQSELIRAKIKPRKGEIIISRMNTPELVGASGYVDKDFEYLYLPDRLWQTVFKIGVKIDTKWLSYVLKSIRFRMLLSITAKGASPSMKNLTQEDFLKITVPFPDLDEQIAIVHRIKTEIAFINAKIAKTKKIIELQKEYRTALISEVVTGKIKVTREAAS